LQFPSDLLDEINLKIIDILERDASKPFVEIAKELEISDATVHMRVRRLVAAGIIRRFTIATDSRLLGYDHLAFMGINIKEGSADEVNSILSKFDEVLEIHEMHGRFDLILKIRARSLEEMRDIVVNKVRKLPQIKDVELMAVLKTVKEEQSVSLKKDISDKTGAAAT
jgi:Lrp/AsnC family transcriptional regulator for asnA, asnC and gidA